MAPRAVGIDVGSTTAKVVVLASSGAIVASRCERHRGRARETVAALLASLGEAGDAARGVTGSLGLELAAELGAVGVHEVRAVARAVRARHPEVRTVVELGGQDAKILFLGDSSDGDDAQMNDRCAAGTGATIDRIALRLGLDAAQVRLCGDARVAARCGVFAERDVVSLVKRGGSAEEAMAALLRAIVVQNLSLLARGRLVRAPVLLLGGPHAHLPALVEAWREALGPLWAERGVEPGDVRAPPDADRMAALGAALAAAEGARPSPMIRGVVSARRADGVLARDPALAVAPSPRLRGPGMVRAHLGIDAGSTTSKAVLLDPHGELLALAYAPSRGDPVADARDRLVELDRQACAVGASLHVLSLGVTGYGAPLVGPALGADATLVETLAHAAAARRAAPDVEVVVDVGGTDVKVLRLDRGGLSISEMHLSNQCAAGMGAFLVACADDLGVSMEAFADLALAAARAPHFSAGCAVFLDTDRVTFQRDGFSAGEILAGLAQALPRNVWEFVVPVSPARLGRRFLLTGGAHRNHAVAVAHARYLEERVPGAQVKLHPHPEACGAIGAALSSAGVRLGASSFVGFGALQGTARLELHVASGESTRCTRCELGCARSIFTLERPLVPPRTLVVGNACDRGATPVPAARRSAGHARDLFSDEGERLFRPVLPVTPVRTLEDAPRIGVPRVMGLYRSASLLLAYLRAAGVPDDRVVLSPPTTQAMFHEGSRRGVHDPCFPAKVTAAHVDWLLRHHEEAPIDALLLPAITHATIAVRGVADTASCPIVASSGHVALAALRGDDLLARMGIRALTPELCLSDPQRLEAQLLAAFGPLLGLSEQDNRSALAIGMLAQRTLFARARERGARVLRDARRAGRAVAVMLARPYHADSGVQHGVSVELAARGIPVLSIGSLPVEDPSLLDLSSILPGVTNSGCAEKIWAARVIAATPHLVAVDLSSFRCGQDASIHLVVGEILGDSKPVLRLHDLDEDHPGASLRLAADTFLASVRRHERDTLSGARPCDEAVA